jgi:hypothetical protein
VTQTAPARRRVLPGAWFPVVVFVVWRLAHLGVLLLWGGDAVDDAFRWDGRNYRRIFADGYHVAPDAIRPRTAFFPLTPWLAHVPDVVLPSKAAMVLTANVLALLAFVAVWGAARCWADERVARRSVVLLALWPPSLFLWAFYAEAGFVAASAGAVWADRRRRPALAAVLLTAAALARTIGVLVAAVLVGVRIWRRRRVDAVAVLYAFAGALGTATVMVVQHQQAGDALAFTDQEEWGRSWAFPWVALRGGVRAAFRAGAPVARWLDLLAVVAAAAAVAWALWWRWRRREGRGVLPIEPPLLTAVLVGVPLCTRLLTSMNRWLLAAWPTFVIGASALGLARKPVRWAVYVVLAVVSVLLLREWADGTFVG